MARNTFPEQRHQIEDTYRSLLADFGHTGRFKKLIADGRGWSIFVGFDRRGYPISVQRANDERAIMVRAGCRYMTLRRAMKHWGRRSRGQGGKQILQMIEVGLATARYCGYIRASRYPKFFSTKLTNR